MIGRFLGTGKIKYRNSDSKRRNVFFSIAAQADNLGDIEIRRIALDWLRNGNDSDLRIFVGDMPPAYIDAFGLSRSARLYDRSFTYQLELIKQVMRRRAHLVFAPGPRHLGRRKGAKAGIYLMSVLKAAINLTNAAVVRISGGKVIVIGRALRGTDPVLLMFERILVIISSDYRVRDTASSSVLGRPVSKIPDVAFDDVRSDELGTDRTFFVMSFRGDHPASLEILKQAVDEARRLLLEPVLLTQVRSDNDQHQRIATALGCKFYPWTDESHGDQLLVVNDVYSRARVVLSDRLHALIFGIRQGAVPIALVHLGNDKLLPTIDFLAPNIAIASDAGLWDPLDECSGNLPDPETILSIAKRAREELSCVEHEIHRLIF